MTAGLPGWPHQTEGEPKGVVFELDDLLSIVELAKAVEAQAPSIAPLGDNEPLPLRVSVGDALHEAWVAHVVIDPPRGDTYVDFTYEKRTS